MKKENIIETMRSRPLCFHPFKGMKTRNCMTVVLCWFALSLLLFSQCFFHFEPITKEQKPIQMESPQILKFSYDINETGKDGGQNTKFSYMINEEMMCADWDDLGIVLMVGVTVGLEDFKGRAVIRKTWGRTAKENPSIKLIFFVGSHSNPYYNYAMIQQESNRYNDIVMANFIESYRNLTRKSFALFHWVTTYCNKARYLLKIDADMMIDLVRLLVTLETKNVPDKFSCGKVLPHERVYRQLKHKWYVSKDQYIPDFFPTYCHGPAYIVPRRILFKLTKVQLPVNPFPIEDVFITGFLRSKMKEGIDDNVFWFNHEKKAKINEGYFGVIKIKT